VGGAGVFASPGLFLGGARRCGSYGREYAMQAWLPNLANNGAEGSVASFYNRHPAGLKLAVKSRRKRRWFRQAPTKTITAGELMNQIRQNKATKQWVIFATDRGKRPHDFQRGKGKRGELPAFDHHCPFCQGNEAMLPSILMERPGKNPNLWQTRIVPNKYSALAPDADTKRVREGIYVAMQGYGRHEVIIESPFHNQQIALMSSEEVEIVIETYHRRYVDLMKAHRNMMIIIFRNHGLQAGTSLAHPHSQLIATGMVPNYIRRREEEAQRYFDEWGRCVYCDILNFEMQDRRRVVLENSSFLAFVPYAADVPFEIWIMPKNHRSDFGQISDESKADLGLALRNILGRLHKKLNDPDYNYLINTSPHYRANEPQLHWYLQIRPRLITPAGFEIGSGVSINPSFPEADADFLNSPEPEMNPL
jgi:UDPglucose--hexose-1-phosphate uridylyltransferase